MDNYYSYIANTRCNYCNTKEYTLVQLSSDVTCTRCGAEQNMGSFVESYTPTYSELESRNDKFSEMTNQIIKSSKTQVQTEKQIHYPIELFNDVQIFGKLSDSVITSAKAIYKDFYINKGRFVGDKRALVMATVYYGARGISPVSKPHLLKAVPHVSPDEFTKARNTVYATLLTVDKYHKIFCDNTYDITHDLNRVLSKLTCISSPDLRGKVYKFAERMKRTAEIDALTQNTIVNTLVYMAARKLKLKFTMVAFAAEAGMTCVTIMSTEEKIKKAIMPGR